MPVIITGNNTTTAGATELLDFLVASNVIAEASKTKILA